MNKEEIRQLLYNKDGAKCHYCGIDEGDFITVWGAFYGGRRGTILEVDRKDSSQGYNLNNCVLACAICNNAKSDKFTYKEFKKLGESTKQIWEQRREASQLKK